MVNIEIYGGVPRTKTNEQMIAELDALRALGWRGLVFIVDDNFIGKNAMSSACCPNSSNGQSAPNVHVVLLR